MIPRFFQVFMKLALLTKILELKECVKTLIRANFSRSKYFKRKKSLKNKKKQMKIKKDKEIKEKYNQLSIVSPLKKR